MPNGYLYDIFTARDRPPRELDDNSSREMTYKLAALSTAQRDGNVCAMQDGDGRAERVAEERRRGM